MDERKKRRKLLMLLLAAVFLISAAMSVYRGIEYRRIAKDSAEATEIAGLAAQTSAQSGLPSADADESKEQEPEQPEPEPEPEQLPEEAAALTEIDLTALQEINEEVVGWLAIPGTEISYPLMQGSDNSFYLTHNWKQERSRGGSVFLEATCSRDLSDFHTIAYAHRMSDGSLFGTLSSYQDLDFWAEHPNVYVVLNNSIYRYEIFSAGEAGVKSIVYLLDIEEENLENAFLRYCLEKSVIDTGIVPEADDSILTLSTCTGNGHATRWVVHARLAYIYAREPISASVSASDPS